MRALKIAGAAVAAVLVVLALLLVIGIPSGFLTSAIRARVGYIGFVVLVSVVGLVAIATAGLHDSFINGTRIPDNCAMYCPREHGYAFGNVLAVVAAAVGNVVGTVVLAGGAGYSTTTTPAGVATNPAFALNPSFAADATPGFPCT